MVSLSHEEALQGSNQKVGEEEKMMKKLGAERTGIDKKGKKNGNIKVSIWKLCTDQRC